MTFTHSWAFSVHANTPNLMRAPGLDDPNNWDVTGLDDTEWDSARMAAESLFVDLRAAAPEGTVVEDRTPYVVLVNTEDRAWFDRFYRDSTQIDFVAVYQEPGRPAEGGEETELYMYDKNGVIGG